MINQNVNALNYESNHDFDRVHSFIVPSSEQDTICEGSLGCHEIQFTSEECACMEEHTISLCVVGSVCHLSACYYKIERWLIVI